MHLIGLVIAGQRVHHDIDPAAQGHFALARAARIERIEAVAALVAGPGRGQIIGGDDDRRNAVARARRAAFLFGVGRQRLDIGRAVFGAADEILQQIEGLGDDMVARRRLQRRQVDVLQKGLAATPAPASAGRPRTAFRRRACRTAPARPVSYRPRCAARPPGRAAAGRARRASRSADRRPVRRARDRCPAARSGTKEVRRASVSDSE